MDIRAKKHKGLGAVQTFFSRNERRKWERRSSWKTGWHVLLLDVRPCQTTYRRSKFTFKYVGHMFDSTMHPHWFMVLGTFQLSSRLFSSSSSSSSIFTLITGWYWILPAEHRQSPWPLFSFDFTALESAGRIVPFQTSPSEWIETLRAVLYTSFDKRRKKKRNQLVCVYVISSLSFPFVRGKVFFFSSSRNCERNGKDYQRINGLWKSHAQLSARARWSLQRRQSISCYLIPDRVLEQLSPLLQLSSISQ